MATAELLLNFVRLTLSKATRKAKANDSYPRST